MNARQRLADVADWLGLQDEDLSSRLRNAFDALRLHDYAQAHPKLPEMADEWAEKDFVAAIGYNPADLADYSESEVSGAAAAAAALEKARALLDSVAFVSVEGDTRAPIAAIDAILPL